MTFFGTLGTPRVKFNSGVNIIFDGNSLVAGFGSTAGNTMPEQMMRLPPLLGSGATMSNVGIGGQTTAQMTSTATDVDGAWVSGKTNILVCWEMTNSVHVGSRTGVQAAEDLAAYVAARRAAHPLLVLSMTTLPRLGDATQCQYLVDANNYLLANYRSMGIDAVVDVRAIPQFNFTGINAGDFIIDAGNSPGTYWVDWSHCNDNGYGLLANALANQIKYLPRKAS
jgi:hypothetical protein